MVKEFKIISNKYAEKIIDELNEHGRDDWDVTAYVQEFGVTKFVLERDTNGGNPLSGNSLDTLTGLVNLINNKDQALKLISDLKAAYASHVSGLDNVISSQEDLKALIAESEKVKDAAVAEKTQLDAVKAQLEEAQSELEANKAAVSAEKAEVEKLRLELAEKAKADAAAVKAIYESNNAQLSLGNDQLSKLKTSLDAREAAITTREKSLSLREQDADEIRLQAEALAQKVTGRRI